MEKLDIFWLVDATGSMAVCIEDVKRSISETWGVLGSGYDLAQGVGFYRDMDNPHEEGYGVEQRITKIPNFLQQGAQRIEPRGGGDTPESQVYALTQVGLEIDPAQRIGWRADATRIVVWAGDYFGHLNQEINGLTYTNQGAIDALNSKKITPYAFSMAPVNQLNNTNGGNNVAASEIVFPTGGDVFQDVNQNNAMQFMIQVLIREIPKVSAASKSMLATYAERESAE